MNKKSLGDRQAEQSLNNLSEFESAKLLAGYGIPTAKAMLAHDWEAVKRAGKTIGYPVVLKLSSSEISHKTEKGVVAVDLHNEAELGLAFNRIREASAIAKPEYLVQEMVKGGRELVVGMVRDAQFGPCVMFGLGGIFTEILGDVVFRPAPLSERDAAAMLQEIKGNKILDLVRGMPAVNRESLLGCLMAVGKIGLERADIMAIDINPLIVRQGEPVAVDALVVLRQI
ncbi:MAG: acetate--CoA ligase family protein [Syntrophobacterales bacterium]|nr:acetate--CoA ligase family protein [Syntrophobacterales bacterium]